MFSIEEHLMQAASRHAEPVSARPLIGASLRGRQFAATLGDSAADSLPPSTTDATTALSSSALAQNPQSRPFYISNPDFDPTTPFSQEMIQDPSATATPQAVQWTSPNGLTTTGVMNPFGLTQNNPSIGYYGAQPLPAR